MNGKNMRWILLGVLILIIFGMQNTIPKESVADVEGQVCSVDEDCPCFGQIEGTGITAYGLGVATCTAGTCDTTYCFDVQPIGEYFRDNQWAWLKGNPVMTLAIIGLTIVLITWPKV